MASHGRNTDDDEVQRSKELVVMGEDQEKLSVQRFMFAKATKRSVTKKLWSILGILPCSILRIWRLWAQTKHEYTMDDFSTLTFREPWLLKKISTSSASTWLVERNLMLQDHRDLRQTGISKRPLRRKGRLIKEFHNFLYERWLRAETSEQSCSHLYLSLWIWVVDFSLF
jgi:hypothetical protein